MPTPREHAERKQAFLTAIEPVVAERYRLMACARTLIIKDAEGAILSVERVLPDWAIPYYDTSERLLASIAKLHGIPWPDPD